MDRYEIYLMGKQIDIIFQSGVDEDTVKDSLVNHDGYNRNIVVRKVKKARAKDNRIYVQHDRRSL